MDTGGPLEVYPSALQNMPPVLFISQIYCSMGTTAVVLKLVRPMIQTRVRVKLSQSLTDLCPLSRPVLMRWHSTWYLKEEDFLRFEGQQHLPPNQSLH